MSLTAACICGATRYDYHGPVEEIALCSCSQCRRANGGAFNVALLARAEDVEFSARDQLKEFASSPGKYRGFCGQCGAPVYSRRDDLPGVLRLRAGLIAELPPPQRMSHGFAEDGWPWLSAAV